MCDVAFVNITIGHIARINVLVYIIAVVCISVYVSTIGVIVIIKCLSATIDIVVGINVCAGACRRINISISHVTSINVIKGLRSTVNIVVCINRCAIVGVYRIAVYCRRVGISTCASTCVGCVYCARTC